METDSRNPSPDHENRLRSMEQRLQNLEKTESRGFEIVKWGFGSIAAIAFVFAGFNWWTGKTNYDRDKTSLQQQVEIIEKKLSLAEKDSAVSNDKQLTAIRHNVESNIDSVFAAKGKQLEAVLTQMSNAVQSRYDFTMDQVSNRLLEARTTSNVTLSNLISSFEKANNRAEGLSLFVQANQFCRENKGNTIISAGALAGGLSSYASAGMSFLKGDDEGNLRRCLDALKEHLPILLNNAPEASFKVTEYIGIRDRLDEFLSAVEKSTKAARFDIDLIQLKAFSRLLQDKAKRDQK